MGRKSSYLAAFSIFFHGSIKSSISWAKKNLPKIFLSSIKTRTAIKFPPKLPPPPAENQLGTEGVKIPNHLLLFTSFS